MKSRIVKIAVAVLSIALLSAFLALAGEGKAMTYSGWLVDQLCAYSPTGEAGDGTRPNENPEQHSRKCALMPPCIASGYGIFIEKKDGGYAFYKFDKKGSTLAEKYLKGTSKEDHIAVKVTGSMKGNVIKVKTLTEVVKPDTMM